MRVLVVYGGGSSERDVSLRSGASVGAALEAAGHRVLYFDPGDDTTFSMLKNFILDVQVVFPVLHGKGGEDGTIQAVLEALQVPFVGSGAQSSLFCFDKVKTLQVIHDAGVQAPVTDVITYDKLKRHPLSKHPYVLKPRDEGSSVDTVLVRQPKGVKTDQFKPLFDRHGSMLIEELVQGTEITVPVLFEHALPVIEIIPPLNQEFDYTNKYNGTTQELCPPEHVLPAVQQQAQAIAERVHQLMNCRHLSRTDMIITPEGQIYVLEINTMPGMTAQSLFPKAALVAGMTMPQFVDQLVRTAVDATS